MVALGAAPGKGKTDHLLADRADIERKLAGAGFGDPGIIRDLCLFRFTTAWLNKYIKVRTMDRGPGKVVTHHEAMRHVMAKTALKITDCEQASQL